MELPSVHARPRDQPPVAAPRDATRAPELRSPRRAAPVDGGSRRGAVAGSGDRAAVMTVTGDTPALPPRSPSRADLGRQRLAERLERAEKPVTSRTELRDRLNHLAPGHPSSPWEEDGTPRPPVPRLSALERLDPPLSDAAYED